MSFPISQTSERARRENDSDVASEILTSAQVQHKCEIEISLPHLSPASACDKGLHTNYEGEY